MTENIQNDAPPARYLLAPADIEFFEPGDAVIIVIRDHNVPPEEVTRIGRLLEERHPGVQFTIIGDVVNVLVEHGKNYVTTSFDGTTEYVKRSPQ